MLLCLFFVACRKTSPEQFDKDTLLYEQANKRFDRGDYTEATLYYESLKNRFPTSPFATESELKIADGQFAKGLYDESAISYENFKVLHPSHEKVPYSVLRTGLSYYKNAPRAIDRDQTELEKAIRFFSEVLEKWPASKESAEAAPLLSKARRSLLRRELYVANFYRKQKKYDAAIARYNNVRSQTEFMDLSDESTYNVALAQFKNKQYEEAGKTLSTLQNSNSNYYKKSRELEAQIQRANK